MPRAVILARCQFSLNQPRESPWTARSTTFRPPMPVSATERSFSNAMSAMWEKLLSKRFRLRAPRGDGRIIPIAPAAPRGARGAVRRGSASLPLGAVARLGGLLGRAHQDSFSTYQSIVCFRPPAKSVCAGLQPSSRWSLVLSMA